MPDPVEIDFVANVGDANAGVKSLNDNLKATGAVTGQSGLSLTELRSGLMLAEQGARAVSAAIHSVIDPTTQLADQIRELQNTIGGSAEDASKLIQAANETGVSFGSLESGLKAAIRTMKSSKSEGIEPNIAGLAILADKYVAIQDPIQRTKFLMDNFGRSGADLTQMMKLGGNAIRDMGDQTQAMGLVMTQEGVDAAYKYEQSMRNLDDAVMGLKISIGQKVIPVISALANAETQALTTQSIINQAVAAGVITNNEAYNIQTKLSYGAMTQKQVYDQLMPAIVATTQATQAETFTMADNISFHLQEAAALKAEFKEEVALSLQIREAAAARDAYTIKLYGQTQAIRDQMQAETDHASDLLVQAGIQGTVTKNSEAYQQVLAGNVDQIQKLKDEIAKYNALQGASITVVQKGQYSTADLTKAQMQLQIAEERLAETHSKSQATLDSLALSVKTAQDRVDNISGHMATASSTTGNYTAKIAEDQAALDKLTGANSAAETAMKKANIAFVAQQAAAGLTGKALFDVELKMGQIDQPTYDAALAIDTAKKAFLAAGGNNNDSALGQFESRLGLVVDKLNGVPSAADKIPDVLVPATEAFKAAGEAAATAAGQLYTLKGSEDALYDKTITITVHQRGTTGNAQERNAGVDQQYAGGGMFHLAGGGRGPWMVPPGYGQDNYPLGGGYHAGSGETVTVTPQQASAPASGNLGMPAIHIQNLYAQGMTIDQVVKALSPALAQQLRQQSLAGIQSAGQ